MTVRYDRGDHQLPCKIAARVDRYAFCNCTAPQLDRPPFTQRSIVSITILPTLPPSPLPCACRCVAPSPATSSYSGGSAGGGGGGGWTAPQFRRWLAAYLRELRLSPEAVHRALVLRSARPLLEADPALGLSVFLDQQRQGLSHGLLVQRRGGGFQGARRPGVGGAGSSAEGRRTEGRLAPHDVVSFLKTVTPSEVGVWPAGGGRLSERSNVMASITSKIQSGVWTANTTHTTQHRASKG